MASNGDFTDAHDTALYEYFTGVLSGSRMGVKSNMGGQLDRLETAARHPRRDPSIDYIAIRETRAAPTYEIDERALFAAGRMREIEAVLARMEAADVRVLAASYALSPPNATPALLRLVCPEDEGKEIGRLLTSAKAEERRRGKKLLASAQHRAKVHVERVQAAYAEAATQYAEDERLARRARGDRDLDARIATMGRKAA